MRDRIKLLPFLLTFILAFITVQGGRKYPKGDFVTYPATLTVSSTGGAADSQSVALALGVYKKTAQTYEGRPMWQSTVRDDTVLLYTGDWWVIGANGKALIMSKKTGLIDIPLTGWRYSDGNNMHDDNTLRVTEGEPTYPAILTVSSKGGATGQPVAGASFLGASTSVAECPECLDVYTKTAQTWSGRPVWRHTGRGDRFLFYNGDHAIWVISNEVSNDQTYFWSRKKGLINIPLTGWYYDNTLRVTEYPDTLTVSSSGGALDNHFSSMGVYKITNWTRYGRPVWQSTWRDDRFLFYTSGKCHQDYLDHSSCRGGYLPHVSRWVIDDTLSRGYQNNHPLIESKNSDLINIPQNGWRWGRYYSHDRSVPRWIWNDDITLRVTEGEPNYPTTLTVSSTGGAAKEFPSYMGVYKKTTQTWEGRPVWRHTGKDDRFFFYNGNGWVRKWVISNEVSNIAEYWMSSKIEFRKQINIPLTGWQYRSRHNRSEMFNDSTLRVRG